MTLRRFAAPIVIIFLAVYLRMHTLASFVVNIDHAYPVMQVIQMTRSGHWPLIGQWSSVLFDNAPGMPYVLLLPWWWLQSVWGIHGLVALLNVLAVPLLYATMRLLRQGDTRAEVAAFLCAINPWVVVFSQGTWVQGLLVLLMTLTFSLVVLALYGPQRRHTRRLVGAFISLTVLTQTYLLGFLAVIQMGLSLLLNWRRWTWRPIWIGSAIFVVFTAFYAAQILTRWPEQGQKLARFAQSTPDAPLRLTPRALEHALRFVTGRDYEIVYGNDNSPAWQARRQLSLGISGALALTLAGSLIWVAGQIIRRKPDAPFWLTVGLWWGLPIVGMTAGNHPIHIHYLLMTLPAGFVLISPGLAYLLRAKLLRWTIAGLLAGTSIHLMEAARQINLARPAGQGLENLTIQAVHPFQQATSRLIDQYGLSEAYVALDSVTLSANAGRDLAAVNWLVLPDLEIIPADRPALYIRYFPAADPTDLWLARRVAQVQYPGADTIAFDLVPAHTRAEMATLPQVPVEWTTSEGLTLIGYDRVDPHTLRVYWSVDRLEDGREQWLYTPYAHLVNAAGQMVVNVNAPGLPGYLYRAGDVYIMRLEIPPIPAGAYTLELGLVDGTHGGIGITFLPPNADPQPVYTVPIHWP